MKLLIFYQYFGTRFGSWSTRMYELTRYWVAAGHNVTVVTSPYAKSDTRAEGFITQKTVDGVNLVIINTADSNLEPVWMRGAKALLYSAVSCWFALSAQYDILLASSGPITVGFPGLLAKLVRKKRFVFEIRDLWPQNAIELKKLRNSIGILLAKWFEKKCYLNCDLVVACSPDMEHSVKVRYPDTPTIVISNACDTDLFGASKIKITKHRIGIDENWFLYAGSLGLMDDVELIIHAMSEIKDNSVGVLVFGDGSERKNLEKEVEIRGLTERVLFKGLIPKNELVNYLQQAVASIIVFKNYPVLQTSSPNKLFDSLAAGVPIIHNTTGWMRELTTKEECGLSVNPSDYRGLARAMELLVKDCKYRDRLAFNSKRLAEGEFNRQRLAGKYLVALLSLVNINRADSSYE